MKKNDNYFYKAILNDTFLMCLSIEGVGTVDAIHLASILIAQGEVVNSLDDVKAHYAMWLDDSKWDRVSELRFDSLWENRKAILLKDLAKQRTYSDVGKMGGRPSKISRLVV